MAKRKVYFYDAEFDDVAGTSKVTLMTPEGMFSGTAKVNKDEDEFNEIIGGTFAELRAWKAYYKHNIRMRKFALKELNTAYSQMRKGAASEKVLDRIEFLKLEIDHCLAEIKSIDKEMEQRYAILDRKNYHLMHEIKTKSLSKLKAILDLYFKTLIYFHIGQY